MSNRYTELFLGFFAISVISWLVACFKFFVLQTLGIGFTEIIPRIHIQKLVESVSHAGLSLLDIFYYVYVVSFSGLIFGIIFGFISGGLYSLFDGFMSQDLLIRSERSDSSIGISIATRFCQIFILLFLIITGIVGYHFSLKLIGWVLS